MNNFVVKVYDEREIEVVRRRGGTGNEMDIAVSATGVEVVSLMTFLPTNILFKVIYWSWVTQLLICLKPVSLVSVSASPCNSPHTMLSDDDSMT